jgi:hypothetical protein
MGYPLACRVETRAATGDDGPATEQVVVAHSRATPSDFDYDEGHRTLTLRDAHGRDAVFWVRDYVGKVVR